MDFRRGVPNAKVVEKEKGKREEWLVVSRSSKGRLCRSNDHENEEFQSLPSSEETRIPLEQKHTCGLEKPPPRLSYRCPAGRVSTATTAPTATT